MKYHVDPQKPFHSEIKRIATGKLKAAQSAFAERPNGLEEAIHEGRKAIKRVRSLYRLTKAAMPAFRKDQNRRLRDIAHSLSAFRDAQALIETVDRLARKTASADEAKALKAVRSALKTRYDWVARAETDLDAKVAEAARACEAAEKAIGGLDLHIGRKEAQKLLRKGWRKTLEKALAALDACRTDGLPEQFHDLRKRSQDYWMYHALLRPLWPSGMYALQKQAKELADILGHYHDLTVLSDVLRNEPELVAHDSDGDYVRAAIGREEHVEAQRALDLAGRVFDSDIARESRIITRLWADAAR